VQYAEEAGFDPTFDLMTTFFHDVPEDVVEELMKAGEPQQSEAIFGKPFPLDPEQLRRPALLVDRERPPRRLRPSRGGRPEAHGVRLQAQLIAAAAHHGHPSALVATTNLDWDLRGVHSVTIADDQQHSALRRRMARPKLTIKRPNRVGRGLLPGAYRISTTGRLGAGAGAGGDSDFRGRLELPFPAV